MTKGAEIFDRLRHDILSGRYDGKVLPSESLLMRRFAASRTPIRAALDKLENEGLILRRQGAPTKLTRYAKNATGAIGLVVPGVCYAEIFEPICSGIRRLAETRGWDVKVGEIRSTDPLVRAREARRVAYSFAKAHVAGVVLQPLEFLRDTPGATEEVLSFFDKASIPVVLLDYDYARRPTRSQHDLVAIDNEGAGYALGCHLLKTGAKRIAFLRYPGAAPTDNDRLYGVVRAVLSHGGSWSNAENVLLAKPESVRSVRAFLCKMRPDAIVCGNDRRAGMLMATLRKIGVIVPGKVRVAGFDDVVEAARLDPPLTTCRQPIKDLATVAFETLLSRIRHPSSPVRTVLLPAPLVVRASTGG